ncbi:FxsB family cyclophane-forming radical SAM/SPASM peptide maturase [Peterkaempfera sp. SMS 1(5)a]|uniref:FxsB family cyclophane-forming radical SAM/SPASM peptide maturase n=1 Tax=Peterkaempfera podocarpi TaxID=3232308 RepID=UPI00366F5236
MAAVAPFREFVIKLHGLCNIACDHCYVYELRDRGWESRPAVMADPTIDRVAVRIAEHARRHRLPEVSAVLHGGEPLMAGRAKAERLARALRREVDPETRIGFTVQTNGTLLNDAWLELGHRYGMGIGVSLDGDRAANDRHRRRADGRSSHPAVERGLRLLRRPEHRNRYAGLLCTVDLDNPPVATYEALLAQEPPRIDFLLPHATWQHPPPGHDPERAPYAAWLLAVFDRWYRSSSPPETRVRLFEDLIDLSLGGAPGSEAVGGAAAGFTVVETDGSIHLADAYRAVHDGASATGMDVFTHDFDTVARSPRVTEARGGRDALAAQCRQCSVVGLCGGGFRAHRYRPENAFDNPSVYCSDLMRVAEHIRHRVHADVRELLGGPR